MGEQEESAAMAADRGDVYAVGGSTSMEDASAVYTSPSASTGAVLMDIGSAALTKKLEAARAKNEAQVAGKKRPLGTMPPKGSPSQPPPTKEAPGKQKRKTHK